MKLPVVALALLLSLVKSSSAPYVVGNIISNFTLVARHPFTNDAGHVFSSNAPVQLSDFAGKIIFVEFFAVWWGFCVAAAGQTASAIRDFYQNLKGNAHGLPVLHVAANMEDSPSYATQTENFIAQHRFRPIVNDYVRSNNVTSNKGLVRRLFQSNDLRPVFLVINCVSNSPTHAQWQLLVNHNGYSDSDFSQEIAAWRTIIDSVRAPPPRAMPPVVAGGAFQFTVTGQRGQTNRVEASSDLLLWSTVTNLIGTNAPITIRDPMTAPPPRFYRVVRP